MKYTLLTRLTALNCFRILIAMESVVRETGDQAGMLVHSCNSSNLGEVSMRTLKVLSQVWKSSELIRPNLLPQINKSMSDITQWEDARLSLQD